MHTDTSRKQRKSKSKKKTCCSSDSEDDRLRCSSQCSNHSSKSYLHWRRSIRKERYKDKDHDRSSSRTFNALQTSTSTTSTSVSPKNDMYLTKHSDCKEKYRLRKIYKELKHRKLQDEKKSRPKKRRRRLRSFSISNSG